MLCLKIRNLCWKTVSTTCDSGWVRSFFGSCMAAHPSATADGTDLLQVRFLTLEVKN